MSFSYRNLLAYVYIPVIQKELDDFRTSVWKSHRIRKQRHKELPVGIPDHIYTCPDKYGGTKCGINLTEEELREVAMSYYECERIIPNTDDIKADQAANAFLYLKENINVGLVHE